MVYVNTPFAQPALPSPAVRAAWLDTLCHGLSEAEATLLRSAVALASEAHRHQLRASGEPYLSHAFAVADILAGLNMDPESIAAAMLHDVVEDTEVTLAQVAAVCNPAVAHLVDGLTKMRAISALQPATGRGDIKAESLRKLLLAMAEDVRVVLIKLADRLHNMRTLKHLSEEKQRRIARETMDIYAPLANRLGIWQVKWELEDLAFRYLEPTAYRQIARFLRERRVDRQRYIDEVLATLDRELQQVGVVADIKGRPKHIYSIWKKMQRKGIGFHELYDVRAVRILVESVADCYHALGVVHTLWPHIPREFDDYIATPKENRYRSIHTAVVGPKGQTLEVQIRTHDMNRHAELGVAAHWRYKEGGRSDADFEQRIAWLRQLLDWKEEEGSAGEFIDRFKSEVFQDRVYVLTPDGEVIDLPQGATPLDFAYHIHTEVGHRCRGARINSRIVPLTYELHSGEQVEVMTARQGGPSRDWMNPHLGYLKTSRARSKVRYWFKQQDQQQNLHDGRAILDRELHRLGVDDLALDRLALQLAVAGVDELLIAVGRGDINTAQIAGAVHQLTRQPSSDEDATLVNRRSSTPRRRGGGGGEGSGAIHIHGVGNLLTTMARCCQPTPGDEIIGFITLGRGVTIHRNDCNNVLCLDEEKRQRLIEVSWSSDETQTYEVDVEIQAVDRQGLLRDVSMVLANEKVNVLAANTLTNKEQLTARMQVTLEVADTDQLSRLLSRINALPNVLEARRRG